MANPFYLRDVVSIKDFKREELEYLFGQADRFLEMDYEEKSKYGRGKLMALMFFEPSTRTKTSFEAAMLSIGGHVIGFSGARGTSMEKGESLSDTIRVMDRYADVLVIRNPMEGAARYAAELAEHPVINAGSGSEEHPTQALLDLFTIRRLKGGIDGLRVAVVGDLKYGRTVYSLLNALKLYSVEVYLVSPPQLRIREEALYDLKGMKIHLDVELDEALKLADVIYVTRIQRERFPHPEEYEKVKGSYKIDARAMRLVKEDAILLHPLPRVGEIAPEVDGFGQAKYFEQVRLGRYLRETLLALILNENP